jgi:hypothetical protein
MYGKRTWSKDDLCKAIAQSDNLNEALRKLGVTTSNGTREVVKKYIKCWDIDTSHFLTLKELQKRSAKKLGPRNKIPLDQILVNESNYSRKSLKQRLFKNGMKQRKCELCGQGELWMGKKMSLILDHINGKNDDNRIENLRIVCPNCGATLPTHGGKNITRKIRIFKSCSICGKEFSGRNKCCSFECSKKLWSIPKPNERKVERPSLELLLKEISESSYVAVGKKYGVTDNTIRKWIRWHGIKAPKMIKPRSKITEKNCCYCNKNYKPHDAGQKFCSRKCSGFHRRKAMPSREELEKQIKIFTYKELGGKYRVGKDLVQDWATHYELTKRRRRSTQESIPTPAPSLVPIPASPFSPSPTCPGSLA